MLVWRYHLTLSCFRVQDREKPVASSGVLGNIFRGSTSLDLSILKPTILIGQIAVTGWIFRLINRNSLQGKTFGFLHKIRIEASMVSLRMPAWGHRRFVHPPRDRGLSFLESSRNSRSFVNGESILGKKVAKTTTYKINQNHCCMRSILVRCW